MLAKKRVYTSRYTKKKEHTASEAEHFQLVYKCCCSKSYCPKMCYTQRSDSTTERRHFQDRSRPTRRILCVFADLLVETESSICIVDAMSIFISIRTFAMCFCVEATIQHRACSTVWTISYYICTYIHILISAK